MEQRFVFFELRKKYSQSLSFGPLIPCSLKNNFNVEEHDYISSKRKFYFKSTEKQVKYKTNGRTRYSDFRQKIVLLLFLVQSTNFGSPFFGNSKVFVFRRIFMFSAVQMNKRDMKNELALVLVSSKLTRP